jgi:hypothetical protein
MTNDHNGEAVITATNMAPGDSATEEVTIGNDGTVPFELYVQSTLSSVRNALTSALTLTITRSSDNLLIYRGALSSGAAIPIENLAVNGSTKFNASLSLSASAGNGLQSLSASVDLVWSGQG